jgi:hypothetical protein
LGSRRGGRNRPPGAWALLEVRRGYTTIQAYNATAASATARRTHLAPLKPGTSAAAKLPAAPSASIAGKGLNLLASFGSLRPRRQSASGVGEPPHLSERFPPPFREGSLLTRPSFTVHVRFRRARSTVFDLYFNHRFTANAHHISHPPSTHGPHVVPRGEPANKRVRCPGSEGGWTTGPWEDGTWTPMGKMGWVSWPR